jgi:hypothetical protein
MYTIAKQVQWYINQGVSGLQAWQLYAWAASWGNTGAVLLLQLMTTSISNIPNQRYIQTKRKSPSTNSESVARGQSQ